MANLGRARCLVNQCDWMAAWEVFAAVLRLEPMHYSAWLESGHLSRQMGELQRAAKAYQRAIDAAPQRYEAPQARRHAATKVENVFPMPPLQTHLTRPRRPQQLGCIDRFDGCR